MYYINKIHFISKYEQFSFLENDINFRKKIKMLKRVKIYIFICRNKSIFNELKQQLFTIFSEYVHFLQYTKKNIAIKNQNYNLKKLAIQTSLFTQN